MKGFVGRTGRERYVKGFLCAREGSIGRISAGRTGLHAAQRQRGFFFFGAAMKSLARYSRSTHVTGRESERKVFIRRDLAGKFPRRPSLPFNYAILHASVCRYRSLRGAECKYTAGRSFVPSPRDPKTSVRSRFEDERIITFYKCTFHPRERVRSERGSPRRGSAFPEQLGKRRGRGRVKKRKKEGRAYFSNSDDTVCPSASCTFPIGTLR